ncbi:MAG: zinc ABC transporter solute-binding protein [Sulfitobacter sp.]|nr:zinc ABC transporter solute-binding protein [Sulfitobacter sp.]
MRALLLSSFFIASTASAEVPRVVADIAPIHGLVARVMEGLGEPGLILQPGASPHHHAMRPSEARALSQADLVIWVGHGLTPWLEDPIENLAGDASHLSLAEVTGSIRLPSRAAGVLGGHDHDHDHGHEDEEGAGVDPHLWLDPDNARLWLARIAEALADRDPENANIYRANAEAGQREIAAAEQAVAAQLGEVTGVPFVVLHDGFHYFEAHFGIEALAAVKSSEADTPGPARLSALRETLKESGARCALSEPQIDDALLRTAVEGMEINFGTIDPLGADIPLGTGHYPALLKSISAGLSACLAPSS